MKALLPALNSPATTTEAKIGARLTETKPDVLRPVETRDIGRIPAFRLPRYNL